VSLPPSEFMAHETERDLNNVLPSARLKDEPSEAAGDLKKEAFSTEPDAEPSEALKYILRPLK